MPIGKAQETTIGEHAYRMTPLGAVSGRRVRLRIMPALLRGASAAVSAGAEGLSSIEDVTIGAILAGGATLIETLGEANYDFLCDTFAEVSEVSVTTPEDQKTRMMPMKAMFDQHFSGNYAELDKWIAWGIKVNRFLDGLLELAAKAQASEGTKEPSSSPKESTGGSGGSSSAST